MEKVELFGVNFDCLTMDETINLVEKKILKKEPTHLLGVNADKINQLNIGEKFENIVKKAEIINADGASIILASKILKKRLPERVAGIDLMQGLLDVSNRQGYTVYFLGAKEASLKKMINNVKKKYCNLEVAGYGDGYFSDKDWINIANEISKVNPDIVFVGITSPKKEYLIDFFINYGVNSVFMGVGGSFDVLSGNVKRAPNWIQKINMEWLYRLFQEPKRLFKRYLFGNTKFIWKVFKEKIKHGKDAI